MLRNQKYHLCRRFGKDGIFVFERDSRQDFICFGINSNERTIQQVKLNEMKKAKSSSIRFTSVICNICYYIHIPKMRKTFMMQLVFGGIWFYAIEDMDQAEIWLIEEEK
ncbi:hypothetical protein [Paenibacillus guangzhouensis]|uniref:hypothetical protein n=1 Tax=Paenibacillus guangzhouensis TaxID=1473112 RepID=UPI001266B8CE|nr:hypothetical protein [Paenibacillus guangzhouensis]